jgi:hypothetical protein
MLSTRTASSEVSAINSGLTNESERCGSHPRLRVTHNVERSDADCEGLGQAFTDQRILDRRDASEEGDIGIRSSSSVGSSPRGGYRGEAGATVDVGVESLQNLGPR